MTKKDFYTKEVFKLFDEVGYTFGCNFTIDDVSVLNGLIIDHYPEYEVHTGASKCVIVPNDKSYVIKIPFTGEGADEIYENDMDLRLAVKHCLVSRNLVLIIQNVLMINGCLKMQATHKIIGIIV